MSKQSAGYFRIGLTELSIPPTDIVTSKVQNAEEFPTLRAAHVMYRPTGQTRWDATINWKAVADTNLDGSKDYSDWEDLVNIVAMFRAAPFVEVENDYLRQAFSSVSELIQNGPLVMALRQLTITTNPDLPDALDCSLQMTLFNYLPYASRFAYLDASGNSVPRAINSAPFASYIDNWKSINLPDGWQSLEQGLFNLGWRQYIAVPIAQDPTQSSVPTSVTNPPVTPATNPPKNVSTKLSDVLKQIIPLAQSVQSQYGIPASITLAQALLESSNGQSKLTTQYNNWFGIKASKGQSSVSMSTAEYANGKYTTQGADFATYSSAADSFNAFGKFLGQPRYKPCFTYKDNPVLFAQQLQICGYATDPIYAQKIVDKIKAYNLAQYDQKTMTAPAFNLLPSHSPTLQVPVPLLSSHAQTIQADPLLSLKKQMSSQGWIFDHNTDETAFFFQENNILLASEDSTINNQFDMYPVSIAVVLVNNLAQIPLAGYQIPTYQHIGPATGFVSVSFQSVGSRQSDEDEPQHAGLQALTEATDQMQEQFLVMRTKWRSIDSIHRMQAFFVQNQVLAVAGVGAILPRALESATIPDSSDTIQIQFSGNQYDNVFELAGPFVVQGVSKASLDKAKTLVLGDGFNRLSDQEQQSLSELKTIRDNYVDVQKNAPLVTQIQMAQYVIKQAEGKVDLLTGLQPSTPVTLQSGDVQYLVGVLDKPGMETDGDPLKAYYPGLGTWLSKRSSSSSLTLVEAMVLLQLATPNGIVSDQQQRISDAIHAQAGSVKDVAAQAYSSMVPALLTQNPIAAAQTAQLVSGPVFKSINQGASATPSGDPVNKNHGAYMDMGLAEYQVNGVNVNPAMYLEDTSTIITAKMREQADKALATMQQNSKGQAAVIGTKPTQAGNSDTATALQSQSVFPESTQALLERVRLSGYSMADAYPTFKLFLIEENNAGVFYCIDDFYSYASVISFEIIKKEDGNELAVIRLTNLAQLLSHKVFDATQQGRQERAWNPAIAPVTTSSDGSAIAGPSGSQAGVNAGKNSVVNGGTYMEVPGRNLSATDANKKRMPLPYFPLQTGTKIHIRMGSSNDPDKLTPVFSGVVAELLMGDIVEIHAQGFQSELETVPSKALSYGSMWHLWAGGDAGSILQDLITRSEARHYGHWQINGQKTSTLLHGWNWVPLAASVAGAVSPRVGNLVGTAQSRAAENILINSIIKADGTTADANSRFSIYDEDPNHWFCFTPHYDVPDNANRTIWEIMRDIARRYPGWVLASKPYGFPYGCDATLVFGHPMDIYYSRPPLPGDAEVEQGANNPAASALYQKWWGAMGKDQAIAALTLAGSLTGGNWKPVQDFFTDSTNAEQDAADKAGLSVVNTRLLNTMSTSAAGLESGLNSALQEVTDSWHLGSFGEAIISSIPFFSAPANEARRKLQAVKDSWLGYYSRKVAADGGHIGLRVSPITRMHLVDEQSIVFNGIELNEEIYNEIKINERPLRANANIPPQYVRTLDVTSQIIDPDENIKDTAMYRRIGMSFLREEVGKMYRGELVLRGSEKIEPFDVVILNDPSTGMIGAVEVESVIHSFDLEQGFITIVKPRAVVTANEKASGGIHRQIAMFFNSARQDLNGGAPSNTEIVAGVGTAAVAAGAVYATGVLLGGPAAWLVAAGLAIDGLIYLQGKYEDMQPIMIFPLQRFGRPWFGGLQGYQVTDFRDWAGGQWLQFQYNEWWPTVELFRSLNPGADPSYTPPGTT
jgi:hypothetical protein